MTSAPAVEVSALRKAYGEKQAVDGLDLVVARGEIVAVLGPNGAGKTTTVEILEGFRERDGGDVRVLGEDPARAGRAWRSRLGVVLQSTDDLAEATVGELVRHFARFYPQARDADEVIDAVGLREKVRTRARQLSGGQRRRLDVALGIVGRPELVFLDEPTTGFDPQARRDFWDLVAGLREDGTTILLTTHYLEEAEHLADRVVVVNAGRVVAQGAPADLGGRTARQALVRWTTPDGPREERTDTPTALVRDLAGRYGEVPGLQVLRPTLEDVYLSLIGDAPATTPAAPVEPVEVAR
ncbi:ABC transporter ATP-binding protein [Cellulomonas uda]|uniref:ABC transporter n=1 Tax=Cellulomonas uda TaxID=1714 RepID=A0A4Y3KED0_CELUD|nr:ABC transporter ATP-binding protein [Cellulomonas uda]NII64955.1 ABC-2 type transport system ATP-binding protein [Cellulomonas uda]GEA82006.1 ABC transporter [Cellulomonas uda]